MESSTEIARHILIGVSFVWRGTKKHRVAEGMQFQQRVHTMNVLRYRLLSLVWRMPGVGHQRGRASQHLSWERGS